MFFAPTLQLLASIYAQQVPRILHLNWKYTFQVNSLKNLQIIDLYKKTGPERIIAEAIRLKGRSEFASLSDDQKKVKVLEEYQIVFENFLESFTKDSNIYTMEEYMYGITIDMAKNLHKLLPTTRIAYKI